MWKIIGICFKTGKKVDVATADNESERRMILREEVNNYRRLFCVRICVATA